MRDNQWFNLKILVRGKQVQVRLDDMLVVDYVEPIPPFRADTDFDRVIAQGTFALQGHDANSTTSFKDIRVRPLPEDLSAAEEPPQVDEVYREIMRLGDGNFPVVDYHVHLKGGLTLDSGPGKFSPAGYQLRHCDQLRTQFPGTRRSQRARLSCDDEGPALLCSPAG